MTQISIVNSVTPDFIAQLNENFAQIDAALDGLLAVSSFSGGSTGLTPSSDSQGVIVLGGHLNAAHGGVDFDAGGNTMAGDGALAGLTTGNFNTAFGKDALAAMTTDTYSDAFGYGALIKATGHANAAFGAGAGGTVTTAFDGVYIGADAGRNADNSGDMTGDNNVLVGVHAGGHITSGRFNNFIGNYSGVGGGYYIGHPTALLTGSYNVGLGHLSLGMIEGAASENVALGYNAGFSITGDMNICIGPYAGRNTTTGDLNIMIGRDVQATSVTADAELNIGNLLRGSGLSQGGAPSTGSIGVGVPLSRYPANTLEVYNNTQAGLRLNTDAGGGLYFTDINQQTDGILNIITPAAGYAKFSGDVVVGGGVTTGPKTFPATFKSQTAGGAVLQYAAAASGPNFATVTLASHGTVASPTAVAVSDLLASPIRVQGYDGAAYRTAAQLSVGVAAAVSSGIVPGYWLFETANASGVVGSALALDHQKSMTTFGAAYFSGVGTTASAANAFLDSGSSPTNSLLRSTSSAFYKKDVETLESERADNVIKNARPVWYRSKASADREDWGWYGLIAEEMAEVDPRLVTWGYRDEHWEEYEAVPAREEVRPGPDGEEEVIHHPARMERRLKEGAEKVPDGVAYERVGVMLLDVVRRQGDRIAALEARI